MILRPLFWLLFALGILSLVFAGLTGDFRVSLQFLSVFAPLILFAYLGLSLAILIHELGHVVAGERAGLRFSAMHIGGLVIRRDGQGRLVFSRIKRAFAGGLAVMDFPE